MQYAREVTPHAVRSFAFSKATKRNSLRTAAAENEQSEITGHSCTAVWPSYEEKTIAATLLVTPQSGFAGLVRRSLERLATLIDN